MTITNTWRLLMNQTWLEKGPFCDGSEPCFMNRAHQQTQRVGKAICEQHIQVQPCSNNILYIHQTPKWTPTDWRQTVRLWMRIWKWYGDRDYDYRGELLPSYLMYTLAYRHSQHRHSVGVSHSDRESVCAWKVWTFSVPVTLLKQGYIHTALPHTSHSHYRDTQPHTTHITWWMQHDTAMTTHDHHKIR